MATHRATFSPELLRPDAPEPTPVAEALLTARLAEVEELRRRAQTRLEDVEILRLQAAADAGEIRAESDARILVLEREREAALRLSRLAQSELEVARAGAAAAKAESELARAGAAQAKADAETAKAEAERARTEAEAAKAEVRSAKAETERVNEVLARRTAELTAESLSMRNSWTWRATGPLRKLAQRLPMLRAIGKVLEVLYWRLTFQQRRRRQAAEYALLNASGLFDAAYYLQRYPDVYADRSDPLAHYLVHGAAEGRDPSPRFDAACYLAEHPDVRAAGVNPLLHYVQHGVHEHRRTLAPAAIPEAITPLATDQAPAANEEPAVLAPPVPCLAPPAGAETNPAPAVSQVAVTEAPFSLKSGGRSILVVDHRLLTPDLDSGSVRMFALVHLLVRLGYAVTFVADADDADHTYALPLRELGVQVLWGLASAQALLRGGGEHLTHVLLSRPSVAERYLPTIRAYAPLAQLIFDCASDAELHREIQSFAFRAADAVLATTEPARRAVEAECPGVRVEVIPHIYRVRAQAAPWSRRQGLMFIGGDQQASNVDAVTWFAREVLPLVTRELPEVKFRMAGSLPAESLAALLSPNVELLGHLPDAGPSFEEARVFVAPLRSGAGMRGRIGQAMSLGLPLVTTRIGAEGMGLEGGVHALIADEAEEFAKAVVRLYRDEVLWKELRDNALVQVDRHSGEAAALKALERLLLSDNAEPRSLTA